MGDMADYYLDSIPYIPDRRMDYEKSEIQCRYCGKTGLYWAKVLDEKERTSFRLVDGGGHVHSCKEYKRNDR